VCIRKEKKRGRDIYDGVLYSWGGAVARELAWSGAESIGDLSTELASELVERGIDLTGRSYQIVT
jgi:hypothetical protein